MKGENGGEMLKKRDGKSVGVLRYNGVCGWMIGLREENERVKWKVRTRFSSRPHMVGGENGGAARDWQLR